MADKCTIPVINLHKLPNQIPELISACENWGCFRLINHHDILSTKLMSEMKTVVRSLLDLPVEIKRRNSDIIAGSGYMAPSTKNPLYEALGLYDMSKTGDVERFCEELDATRDQSGTTMNGNTNSPGSTTVTAGGNSNQFGNNPTNTGVLGGGMGSGMGPSGTGINTNTDLSIGFRLHQEAISFGFLSIMGSALFMLL